MLIFGRKTLHERVERAIAEQLAQSAEVPGYDFDLCATAAIQRVSRMYAQEGKPLPREAAFAVREALSPHA